jgi:cytochrome c-type biogenesis protein CcmF
VETPLLYKISGLWGGQAGSLLFWSLLLSGFVALAVVRHRKTDPELTPWAAMTLVLVLAFFLILNAWVESPFRRLPLPLANGRGLNPLLEDPGMVIHPPILYVGYTGMSVPFAFAIAALITKRLDAAWLAATRRWSLFAWGALGAGILVGGWWAYRTLGWGGYWGWDPVENAALIPWLTGAAYVHSAVVQERRGQFAAWNMALVVLTFSTAMIGTFLTRSGLIASVHTFAQSEIGGYFLVFLGAQLLASFALIAFRWDDLKTRDDLDSLASREGAFLFNNALFLGLAVAVLVGTVYPMVSEVARGAKVFVGPPYFNTITGPVGVALLLLMGVSVTLPWRRASAAAMLGALRWPAGIGLALAIAAATTLREPGVVAALAAIGFAFATTVGEYGRGAARVSGGRGFAAGLLGLLATQRRRYGGYLAHLAILVFSIGIVGSQIYVVEREVTVRPGESFTVGRYSLRYAGLERGEAPNASATRAVLRVDAAGASFDLRPLRLYYPKWQQPVSRPAIRSGFEDDVYAILAAFESDGRAAFRVWVNPLVRWIWIGGALLLLGIAVSAWPQRRPRRIGTRAQWALDTLRDLDADRGDGRLSEADYRRAAPALQRTILAELDGEARDGPASDPPRDVEARRG